MREDTEMEDEGGEFSVSREAYRVISFSRLKRFNG